MLSPDVFIEFDMEPPKDMAAIAMPAPTIARISAYSAADAPARLRRSRLMKLTARSLEKKNEGTGPEMDRPLQMH
jgi:hypothetical protein